MDLGREAFENRRLLRKTIEKSASVLQRYQRVCRNTESNQPMYEWLRPPQRVSNRLVFVDRIYVATGLNVESIDEAEVNRITYMGVMPQLQADPSLADGKSLVVEVGGGNTEMLLLRGGNVLESQSFRLGSLRLLRMLKGVRSSTSRRRSMMESHIRRALNRLTDEKLDGTPVHVVAIGGDIRFACKNILTGWDGQSLAGLPVNLFDEFTSKILKLDEDAIVRRYGVSYTEAETLGPALLVYTMLARHLSLDDLFVCDTNLRDGLLQDMSLGGGWTADFRNQIVRSAISLGRKFDLDESHARNVAELARKLFQQLQHEHLLDSRHEVILFVAALLHEIGLLSIKQSQACPAPDSSQRIVWARRVIYCRWGSSQTSSTAFQPSHVDYGSLAQEDRGRLEIGCVVANCDRV